MSRRIVLAGLSALVAGCHGWSFSPPMLLMHGLDDETVWPKNSRNLAGALGALGVPVTLNLYPKRSHADTVAALTTLLRGRAPTLADITAFINQS